MNSKRRCSCVAAIAWMLSSFLTANLAAQVKTHTGTTSGTAIRETTVQTATVILVDGNDLVVKLPDGSLRHFPNVPESFRANIDGQQLGIHDLRPGMTLQRTVVKTTTPQTITTVQSVKGKVWHVNPPLSVILTLEDGTNQSFKIPNGQKFNIDGKMVDAWGLKKGMRVSATRVVEEPQTVISHEVTVAGTAPPPQPPPPDQPILIAILRPAAPVAAPEPPVAEEPATLPKTASVQPLIALLGLASLSGSLFLKLSRR